MVSTIKSSAAVIGGLYDKSQCIAVIENLYNKKQCVDAVNILSHSRNPNIIVPTLRRGNAGSDAPAS